MMHITDCYGLLPYNQQRKDEDIRFTDLFFHNWSWWILPDGSYGYISPMFEVITGYSKHELFNNPYFFLTIIHPDDCEHWIDYLCKHVQYYGRIAQIEFRLIAKDESIKLIRHKCRPAFSSDGHWLGCTATGREI